MSHPHFTVSDQYHHNYTNDPYGELQVAKHVHMYEEHCHPGMKTLY